MRAMDSCHWNQTIRGARKIPGALSLYVTEKLCLAERLDEFLKGHVQGLPSHVTGPTVGLWVAE